MTIRRIYCNFMREFFKKLFLRWAETLKCHPECPVENPCHCHFCGKPNSKTHLCEKVGLNLMDPGKFQEKVIDNLISIVYNQNTHAIKNNAKLIDCQCWYMMNNGELITSFCKMHHD